MKDAGTPVATGAEPVLLRLRNPGDVRVPVPSDAPRRFHASIDTYERTPLHSAPASAQRLGLSEVLVKDESARLGLPSFKILGASWAVHRALAQRLDSSVAELPTFDALQGAVESVRPLTLSTATDGNHGRAVARMAALLGLEARIYVPAGTAQARIDAIASEGASVTVVDGGYDDAVRRSADDAGPRCLVVSDTSWEGYTDVPRWVSDGYATIFSEIDEQLAELGVDRPQVVAVPIGVGALAAAAVSHLWARPEERPRIVGVEPTSAAAVLESMRAGKVVTLGHPQDSLMAGLNCATPSAVAWPLVSRGIDAYLAIDDARLPEAMRLLADDGVIAGETGAAGLAGLLRIVDDADDVVRAALHLNDGGRALLICTEGATDPDSYRQLTGRD